VLETLEMNERCLSVLLAPATPCNFLQVESTVRFLGSRIAADEMIDDVLRVGRDFRPDVGVLEAFELAVSPIWRAHRRSVPGWAGMFRDLTMQICPPSLETAAVPVSRCRSRPMSSTARRRCSAPTRFRSCADREHRR